MGNLFKKSKPPSRVTEADKAVLQLKQQRDKLKQYQKRLHANLEKERLLAKQLLQEGKREKAKLLLRKKKYQEGLIEKTDSQLDTIEQLVHDLEFTQIEAKVVEGLKAGNESLKKMQQLISIEDVEKIMDETQDAAEFQRQISDLLSGGLSVSDESDVMDELNELLAEESQKEVGDLNLPDVSDLPAVDSQELASKQATKETRNKQAMLAS